MIEFWKQPKFWAAAALVLWLAYVIGSNLEEVVVLHIVPWLLQPQLKVSTVVVIAAAVGAALTLWIQFMWRNWRASKNASHSIAASGASSSTVA